MNIYLVRYERLISHFRNLCLDGYTETHHIQPKCLGGTNDKSNLVRLTAKAHYVAHHLLHKAYPENRKLAYAFGMMLCTNSLQERKLTARMYEVSRKAISKAAKGRKRPDLAELNRKRKKNKPPKQPKPKVDTLRQYNERVRLFGLTYHEREMRRKAGKARRGVIMSDVGRASYSAAAKKRHLNAPTITCSKCGHQQKRSPNFYRYHEKNCV